MLGQQLDLFRFIDVPQPCPDATPAQVRMAWEARKLPPLPSARDHWRAGRFHSINLGVGPTILRDAEGYSCEEWRRAEPLIDRHGREVPISLGWHVSNLGRVYFDGWKDGAGEWPTILRHPNGHRFAMLSGGLKIAVARLVAATFLPRPTLRPGLLVRHLDGDPSNDRPENLAWGTARDNHADAVRHGTVGTTRPHQLRRQLRHQADQLRPQLRHQADQLGGEFQHQADQLRHQADQLRPQLRHQADQLGGEFQHQADQLRDQARHFRQQLRWQLRGQVASPGQAAHQARTSRPG